MSTQWKAVLGVILIFVLGFASGVVSSSIFAQRKMAAFLQRPGVAMMNAMEQRLTRNLDLDENQKQLIHHYFMENLRQHKQLQTLIQPQVQELNHATIQQIRAALRPDQLTRLDLNLNELHNRFTEFVSNQDVGNPPQPVPQPNAASTNSAPASPPATQ
ncbi:MAG: hypothetical protein LV481_16415 [Methylacidiphilales bacterium]|nr:hypothetical protein [Candidatus Methylacidiphilales bacterium]